MPGLAARRRTPELMDDPDLDPGRFVGSLAGLRRVNLVTGSANILWPDLKRASVALQHRPLRVLDVACGGGDTLIRLARRALREEICIEWHGCDVNALAVEFAGEQARVANVSIAITQMDVLRDPFPRDIDVIMSSFFLHHLDEADAVGFLARAAEATRAQVLIHDLVRGRGGYWLAALGLRALLCNDVCLEDGPRSVEGAFTIDEARELADKAGLRGAQIEPRFPYRFLLRWSKP